MTAFYYPPGVSAPTAIQRTIAVQAITDSDTHLWWVGAGHAVTLPAATLALAGQRWVFHAGEQSWAKHRMDGTAITPAGADSIDQAELDRFSGYDPIALEVNQAGDGWDVVPANDQVEHIVPVTFFDRSAGLDDITGVPRAVRDTAATQAALDYIELIGGGILFADGGRTFCIDKSGPSAGTANCLGFSTGASAGEFRIRGCGQNSVFKLADHAAASGEICRIFAPKNATDRFTGVVVEDVVLDGNRLAQTAAFSNMEQNHGVFIGGIGGLDATTSLVYTDNEDLTGSADTTLERRYYIIPTGYEAVAGAPVGTDGQYIVLTFPAASAAAPDLSTAALFDAAILAGTVVYFDVRFQYENVRVHNAEFRNMQGDGIYAHLVGRSLQVSMSRFYNNFRLGVNTVYCSEATIMGNIFRGSTHGDVYNSELAAKAEYNPADNAVTTSIIVTSNVVENYDAGFGFSANPDLGVVEGIVVNANTFRARPNTTGLNRAAVVIGNVANVVVNDNTAEGFTNFLRDSGNCHHIQAANNTVTNCPDDGTALSAAFQIGGSTIVGASSHHRIVDNTMVNVERGITIAGSSGSDETSWGVEIRGNHIEARSNAMHLRDVSRVHVKDNWLECQNNDQAVWLRRIKADPVLPWAQPYANGSQSRPIDAWSHTVEAGSGTYTAGDTIYVRTGRNQTTLPALIGSGGGGLDALIAAGDLEVFSVFDDIRFEGNTFVNRDALGANDRAFLMSGGVNATNLVFRNNVWHTASPAYIDGDATSYGFLWEDTVARRGPVGWRTDTDLTNWLQAGGRFWDTDLNAEFIHFGGGIWVASAAAPNVVDVLASLPNPSTLGTGTVYLVLDDGGGAVTQRAVFGPIGGNGTSWVPIQN